MNHLDVAREVSRLKPGEAITIGIPELLDIGTSRLVGMLGPQWSPVDRIMENVVGSSYSIVTREDPISGNVTFSRIKELCDEKDPRMTYVSPDRREFFTKCGDFWKRTESHEATSDPET